jgi:Phage integrase family
MMDERGRVRRGFFDPDMLDSVLAQLPDEHRPVIRFAAITGWRIASEVLPLEWRQMDFAAGEVRLDPGTTKSGEWRVFPLTAALRLLLREQWAEHERLKKAGHICPFVFFREVAEGRGGPKKPQEIISLTNPARPTTDGDPESGSEWCAGASGDEADRAQDAVGVRPVRHRQRWGSAGCGGEAGYGCGACEGEGGVM